MKQLITFLIFAISINAQASKLYESYPTCTITSSLRDSSLSLTEARYTFQFVNLDGSNTVMRYSIDGVEGASELLDNTISIPASPGKHVFQFFYTTFYFEVYTDSLEISPGYHSTYEVWMSRSDEIIEVDKPVIYLYPEVKTEVEVKLDIVGTPTFYYPAYADSWKFTAMPSGDLIFGKNTYNYLFWEAEMEVAANDWMDEGKIVSRAELMPYLESVLEQFHFTSKEKADFITFWAPQMQRHDHTFVRFVFNEACDQFAELTITPTPDQLVRLYILWTPIDPDLEARTYELQQFPELPKRNGFTVLEWGGIEH